MQITQRKALVLAFAGSALFTLSTLSALPAAAQTWPDKPVKIVVPYAAGGGVDNIARIVSQQLAPRLKQPVIIDNRPGANANLGTDVVAKATPDGYTLLMGATFLAFNRATMKALPYDSATDLVPVARTGKAPFVLVVPATLAVKNVSELVAYMKANPDKASYGAVGAGAPTNLIFLKNTGTAPVQVLYKGGAAAMPDLIAGRLTFMIQTSSEVLPYIASGKLKALAVTGGERFKALPDVPTMTQAGVANLEGTGWWGVFAPAKTPAAIVDRVSREVQAVMNMPDVIASLDKIGVESAPMPAAEFATFFGKELKEHANIAREFNITVE
jgi:tripartite-type tricarboxylate transporter receptor subunit TctC